ncbi:MAG: hypothetical protein R3E79_55905 [Caldilineaceae bacterium]
MSPGHRPSASSLGRRFRPPPAPVFSFINDLIWAPGTGKPDLDQLPDHRPTFGLG